jgi:P4 family phage/plasmid primase-like protien
MSFGFYKNLKLTPRESKLYNINLYEPIDINILDKLINSDLLQVIDSRNPINKMYYETEKEQLNKYKLLINDNKTTICYERAKNIKFGRVLPIKALGLFCFRREIRHTLSFNTFEDIDIVSCHHSLLVQICEYNNIKCEYLKQYVNNRESYLNEVMMSYNVSRDIAKNLFIRLLYFGSFKNWIKDNNISNTIQNSFILKFITEIKYIGTIIYNNNMDLCNQINEKNKNKKNIMASVVSYYLQEIENIILEHMYLFCLNNGYIKNNICVLCADGIMIQKELYKSELLNELSEYIFNITEFNLQFVNKKMNEHYLSILDQHQIIDIWNILEKINHSDMAKLYYKLSPNKYIYSHNCGWFKYNKYNVLKSYNKNIPPSLFRNITDTLQKIITNEKNKLIKPKKNDKKYENNEQKYILDMSIYEHLTNLADKSYISIGSSIFIKGMIVYLMDLYDIVDLEILLDSNINLLAFNDKLYDFNTLSFRNIEHTDYITKTTGYNIPDKNEEYRDFLMKLLYSIFEDNEMINYWLVITSLSLFRNNMESFFIFSGGGGNGKGILSSMLVKALGNYFYSADNTFLTSITKSGQANSTLANCNGVRYLFISEPDTGAEDVKFNVDFIKMITGGDIITTRDLYKSNISYKPQFTPFLQCNNKPKLGKVDGGIRRRMKIIQFPFNFVENPIKTNERLIDNTLKNKLNNDYYKELILLLIDIASLHKNDVNIKQPVDVINQTNEYFNDNDPVKLWLTNNCIITDKQSDQIKTSVLYSHYLSGDNEKITIIKFIDLMKINNIPIINKKGYKYFIKIQIIINNDLDSINET